jgi:hypothetical protein
MHARLLLPGALWLAAAASLFAKSSVTVNYQATPTGPYTVTDLAGDWPGFSFYPATMNGIEASETSSGNRAAVVAYGTSRALRVRMPAGLAGLNASTGVAWRTVLENSTSYNLEYRVKFQNRADGRPFDWVQGGKIPGLAGGSQPSGGYYADDGFTARLMWRRFANVNGGQPYLEVYLYHLNQPTRLAPPGQQWGESLPLDTNLAQAGIQYLTPVSEGNYVVREFVGLNTPGAANGYLQVWVNGQMVLDRRNIVFRKQTGAPSDYWYVNCAMMQLYYGGSDASYAPADENTVLIDDIRVW